MMPSMPATLEIRWAPCKAPSFSRISPEGRSITSVGADLEDGDVNAYADDEAYTFISLCNETAIVV